METNEKTIEKINLAFNLSLISLIVSLFILILFAITIDSSARKEQRLKSAISLIGYPASESDIIAGKFYFCEASIVDQWPDRNEKFMLLQEMARDGEHWKIVPGQKRLFRVSQTVEPRSIAEAERTNDILSWKPIGQFLPTR